MLASFSKYVSNVCSEPGPVAGRGWASMILSELAFPVAEADPKQILGGDKTLDENKTQEEGR